MNEAQNGASQAIGDYISEAQKYVTDTRSRVGEMLSTIDSALANSITGIVTGTMTMQEAFHSFFKSIGEAFLKMAAQMIAKLIIIKLLKSAIGLFGGGSEAVEATDSFAGVPNNVLDSVLDTPPAVPSLKLATGGIVNKPTAALIGEGGMNEAVVPLPNGKAIPVDMRGVTGAGNITSNVTVNVSTDGETSSSDPNGAAKLGKAIDTAVRKVILDERRSGGLLYSGR